MNNESLRTDVAKSTAVAVVEVFENFLRGEEVKLAIEEVMRIVEAGLEYFELERDKRLTKPSSN